MYMYMCMYMCMCMYMYYDNDYHKVYASTHVHVHVAVLQKLVCMLTTTCCFPVGPQSIVRLASQRTKCTHIHTLTLHTFAHTHTHTLTHTHTGLRNTTDCWCPNSQTHHCIVQNQSTFSFDRLFTNLMHTHTHTNTHTHMYKCTYRHNHLQNVHVHQYIHIIPPCLAADRCFSKHQG